MRTLLHVMTLLLAAAASVIVAGQADQRPAPASQSWAVFLQPDADNPAETRVIFTDLLTGESVGVNTSGERHTVLSDALLYLDSGQRQVKLVKPDGIIRDHPFMSLDARDFRIDWTVASDGQRIAWATSQRHGDLLSTSLMVSGLGDLEPRQLLDYGPREGIRLIPVAFDADGDSLYVEVHAEGTESASAYRQRSGLFALDIGADGMSTRALPGEETCFCAVGFGDDVMLRLESDSQTPGIALEIHELSSGSLRIAPPVALGSYKQAGNILASPDGALAVYALSQISGLPGESQTTRTVMVLADLENARQTVLNYPMSALARPIAWTEDNSAILLWQAGTSGTWKMRVDDGATVKVADSRYLGMIGGAAAD